MLRVGQAEVDAVAKVIRSGKLFRNIKRGQCERFEKRFARFLGVRHVHLTASGTSALTAALLGLGIGPGDEVIVPAHTYMATAVAVLGAGAIPVIVDIDDSITIDPHAIDDAAGPRTRAVIPVHMWGLACDMDVVMRIARKRKLLVIEDACQGVGGGYERRMLGSIGHAGAFSFNYFKNMTCGEGGAVVTSDPRVSARAKECIEARASEIEGTMLNVQLDRIRGLLRECRRQKRRILRAAATQTKLCASPCHSLDHECGTHVMFKLPTPRLAERFAQLVGCGIAGKTGRHTYNEWEPILTKQWGHHPALNPFKFAENRRCRMNYSAQMLPKSLEILNRTAMIFIGALRTDAKVERLLQKIVRASGQVLTDAATRSPSRHTLDARKP